MSPYVLLKIILKFRAIAHDNLSLPKYKLSKFVDWQYLSLGYPEHNGFFSFH